MITNAMSDREMVVESERGTYLEGYQVHPIVSSHSGGHNAHTRYVPKARYVPRTAIRPYISFGEGSSDSRSEIRSLSREEGSGIGGHGDTGLRGDVGSFEYGDGGVVSTSGGLEVIPCYAMYARPDRPITYFMLREPGHYVNSRISKDKSSKRFRLPLSIVYITFTYTHHVRHCLPQVPSRSSPRLPKEGTLLTLLDLT